MSEENNNEEKELDTSNVRGKEDLRDFLEKIDSEQNIGPFPTRDSSIVAELHDKLEDGAIGYDNEPVVSCPYCNSLYIIDEPGDKGPTCFSCGHMIAERDLVVHRSIYHYLFTKKPKDENSKDRH